MEGITGNIMPPLVGCVCDNAQKVAGTLRKASFLSGILLGAFAVTVCGYTSAGFPYIEVELGFYMANLLLLSNIILVFGMLTEKADFLSATLSINAVLIPATPILVIVSLTLGGRGTPVGATIGPFALVAVLLQCAVVYGCLLEMKGISNTTEKSLSYVGGFNTVTGHKEMRKGESDEIPAIFSQAKATKQADSPPGV